MENVNIQNQVVSNSTGTATPTNSESVTPFVPLDERLAALGEVMGVIKAYDNQMTLIEIEGTRISKMLYQTNKKTGNRVADNSYTRIPTKHLDTAELIENAELLVPYLRTYLQGIEDSVIKADHVKGLTEVYCPGLSLNKIIAELDKRELGGRITKEQIASWCINVLMPELAPLILAKMGFDDVDDLDDERAIEFNAVLRNYRNKLESLASPSPSIKTDDCESLISVIGKCEAADDIGSRLVLKLEKMANVVTETLMTL